MQQQRVFWAVNFPGDIIEKLGAIKNKLRPYGLQGKWVEDRNLHLTVKFLGDVEENSIPGLCSAVEQALASFGPFNLRLEGIGFFPDRRNPRVLWLGVKGEVERMRELHFKVEGALKPLGFAPETRPFRPHLTLARLKAATGVESLTGDMGKPGFALEYPEAFTVASVDLMRSELTPRGPNYHILSSVLL